MCVCVCVCVIERDRSVEYSSVGEFTVYWYVNVHTIPFSSSFRDHVLNCLQLSCHGSLGGG